MAASIAAPTVPEICATAPRFSPRLTPEITRSGGCPAISTLIPSRTASAGVPLTLEPNRWPCSERTSSTRNGSREVSAWLEPLRSWSGATTVTSASSVRISLAKATKPSARMPSSLVRKMRNVAVLSAAWASLHGRMSTQ